MTLKDAKELAIKVLVKTLDMAKLTSEKGKIFSFHFQKTFAFLFQLKWQHCLILMTKLL